MSSKTIKARHDWIDIWRGVVIILIVVGHAGLSYLGGYVYLFHVSVFFFITGLITNYNKYKFRDFFLIKFKRLIIPFIIVNLLFYLFVYSLQSLGLSRYFYSVYLKPLEWIQLFLALRTVDLGGATWFLIVMFFSLIISYIVIKISDLMEPERSIKYSSLIVGFMLFVFAYSVQRNKLQILYNLDLALIASFYMIAAYNIKMFLVSKGQGLDIKMSYEKIFTILFISGLGLLLFYQRGSFVDWPSRSFNNPILDLVQTALGVMLTFAISLLIVRAPYFSKIMAEIGKASLVILCFHFLFFRLYFLILYFLGLTELNTLLKLTPPLGTSPVSLALLIIFSVLLTTGMAILLSRFEKTKSLFSL